MISLSTFYRNHFDTKAISDDNLRKFTDIHLQRLTANNPGGIYDSIIADMAAAYTTYFGAIGSEAVKIAAREGSTVAVTQGIAAFKKDVSQKEGLVRSLYGLNSPEYQEFFPQGVSAYTNADLTNIHTYTQIMRDAATAHAADVGAPFVTLFTNHHTNILAKRQAQLVLMGDVEAKRDTTEAARNAIEVQLMKNIYVIGVNNVGNLSIVDTMFDQSFIQRGGPSEETYNGEVAPNATVNILEWTFEPTDEIYVENTGPVEFRIGLGLTADEAITGGVLVMPGNSLEISASDLGDTVMNHFLNITNNRSTNASYVVTV